MAAEDDVLSKRKAEEEDSSPGAGDQKAHETVADVDEMVADVDETAAAAADVNECSDDEADPFIRNLNLLSKLDLMTPEWIEEMKQNHYEDIDLYNRAYDALENGDISSDDEADVAEYEEWSRRLWASVDGGNLNTVGGESRGMDAIAVYPAILQPREEDEDEDQDDDDDAAAPSS